MSRCDIGCDSSALAKCINPQIRQEQTSQWQFNTLSRTCSTALATARMMVSRPTAASAMLVTLGGMLISSL